MLPSVAHWCSEYSIALAGLSLLPGFWQDDFTASFWNPNVDTGAADRKYAGVGVGAGDISFLDRGQRGRRGGGGGKEAELEDVGGGGVASVGDGVDVEETQVEDEEEDRIWVAVRVRPDAGAWVCV